MPATAGANFEAHDATVGREPGPAPVGDYLAARVEDTAAAVKKIKAMIKGLQESLKAAERLAADAVKARDAGQDLPEVQARRVA